MEKNEQIELLEASLNNRPCQKHDEDHMAIWSSLRIILVVLKELFEKLWDDGKAISDRSEAIEHILSKFSGLEEDIVDANLKINKLWNSFIALKANYPTIFTMQKSALITDGENVLDTVDLESWRYLMVRSITPSDWNEYAKLDKTFSWEIIEVTDGKFDIKIDLDTNTEWETATMTVNVDLLFVKY